MDKNHLYYGDNLTVLRQHVKDESVDLVYLDPPFNSNRNYSVIFSKDGRVDDENTAQIEAFEDTWHWTHETDVQYNEFVANAPMRVADALSAFHTLLGENDAMAYLVNMAPRLYELHRVLKPTGSLYLHCDPTMSHYLKVLLDSIFSPVLFKNEVIWKRTQAHNSAKRFGPQHDVILFYTKSKTYTWNRVFQEYDPRYVSGKFTWRDDRGLYQDVALTGPGVRSGESGKPWGGYNPTANGRHWQPPALFYQLYEELTGESLESFPLLERLDRADAAGIIHWPTKKGGSPRFKQYLDRSPGVVAQDLILDIDPINSRAAERLGYPTQKPVSLMERIIKVSSNPGDVVLDPFCGCGTTVDAAQRLERKWIGVDITYISIDLITKRLEDTYRDENIRDTFDIHGIPSDLGGARALFSQSPFEFERWAVSLINAEPNEKQVADKGFDGVARFPLGQKGKIGKILVSVKGGKNLNPGMVRDLSGAVDTQKADMGILLTLTSPTRGILDAVNHGGTYVHPANKQAFPRLQTFTVGQLLSGAKPKMPATYLPYIKAERVKAEEPEGLF